MAIGVLTMLLVVAPAWVYLILIALGMGLFDGCFISLLGPIAFDLCGSEGASQAIGFLLGLCSIPLTIGPPVAGIHNARRHQLA
jgi:MFS transporter, MCT family, solute carrier family 16 (monocarboxylic acid transporters), member 10